MFSVSFFCVVSVSPYKMMIITKINMIMNGIILDDLWSFHCMENSL